MRRKPLNYNTELRHLSVSGVTKCPTLPQCQSNYLKQEVRNTFNSIPKMKAGGMTALTLSQQSEVSSTQTKRYCSGSMLASDGEEHALSYSVESLADGFYIRVKLQQG